MTELALSGNSFFEISDIEYRKPDKSYTVSTLEELRSLYADTILYFILGIETFLDIPNWWQPEKLVRLIDFIIISRPPFRFVDLLLSPYSDMSREDLERLDKAELESYSAELKTNREAIAIRTPLIEISGTDIRRLVKEGKSIKYLLPEPVESYIISNKLYKS
jgi:nicotinate-nucleotide adenylyltransferase